MSIGPPQIEPNLEISLSNRIRYYAKELTEAYFKDPVYCLAYGFLGFTLLGLFFGMKFSWEYYVILGLLFGVELYRTFTESKSKE